MRDWRGRPAAVVATGHSLTLAAVRLLGMARAKDLLRVIAINDSAYVCWFADLAWASDGKWWRYHSGLPGFPSQRAKIMTPHPKTGRDEHPPGFPGIDAIASSGTEGFDPDPTFCRSGGSSGYQALHRAVQFECDPIILVAFDMHGDHWFGSHPPEIRGGDPNLDKRIQDFGALAAAAKKRGLRVVNASPGSELPYFPIVSIESEIANLEAVHERARAREARQEDKQGAGGQAAAASR